MVGLRGPRVPSVVSGSWCARRRYEVTGGSGHEQPRRDGGGLSQLHIALEEGFSGDEVTVRVQGKPVLEGRAVTTRLQIGRAHAFATEVPEGDVDLEVEVPSRSIHHAEQVKVSGTTYVGVSIGQHGLELRSSSQPFGYV